VNTKLKIRRIAPARIIVPFLLFLANAPAARAQFENYNHPELKWRTIETEHFLVHYHSGISRTPRLIAKIAEEIYAPVTRMYHFEPDGKIHFIVRDHDDYSNGATYYYDNKIEIWATPLDFILRGTTNWLRNVVSHEFTHMIQLQAGRKMPRRIPSLYIQNLAYEDEKRPDVLYGFPKRIISYPLPGTVMPMWLAEGTAQYGAYRNGTDFWDTHRDMILRVHALSDGIYPLKEMGTFGKSSIGNESVYNHGFAFVMYLTERFGGGVLEKISRNMASPFTYTVERAIKKATGVSAEKLYGAWKTELELGYLKRSDLIQKNLVQGTVIDETGSANIFPAWSPDGASVAFLSNGRSDFLSHTGLYVQKSDASPRKLLKTGVVSPPAWEPSGRRIAYSRLKKNRNTSLFHDIFLYDIASGGEKQLTFSRRASYPSFSPDGKTVYYSSGADGVFNLFALDIETGAHRQLTRFTRGEEVFNAAVSPDGGRIAFAVSRGYGRDIAVVGADGSGFRYLLDGTADERDPSFSPDGTKLYYSSDKTGIFNIYEYDCAAGVSMPVTNVLGGAFMPSVNAGGQLVYSLYTRGGYKRARIDNIEYVDPAVMAYSPAYETKVQELPRTDGPVPELASREYEFQYMTSFFLPRFIIDYGKPKLGLYSFSSDALDKYSIFMGAALNRDRDRDLFALLDFRKFRQTLFLEMYNLTRHVSYFYPPNETDDITLGFWEVDIGARQKLSETQEYEFRTLYARQSANIKPEIPGILIKPLQYDYYRGLNFTVKWQYRNVLPRLDREINPSFGREIVLEYWRNQDKIFEDFAFTSVIREIYKKYSYNKIAADWREYIGTPFIKDRSALTLRLQGGLIDREVDDFLYFFAGGLTGIKGYSYYSLEGRKMLIGSATFRFPLVKSMGLEFGPWYLDKLYASIGCQAGDAWNSKNFKFTQLKRGVDLGVRLDMFSFYAYPTRIGFDAAYGFDEFQVAGRAEGKNWKYFLTILFGYDF